VTQKSSDMSPRDTTLPELDLGVLTAAETDVSFRMDEDAFRGFYDRTARPLWAYLFRLTGNRSAADDLLQDAYYRFLRADAPLGSDAHRRHYLFRIATNLAADGLRRQRTRPMTSGSDPDLLATPAAEAALNRRIDVNAAMSRLRVRERAMLWLAYGHGASHEEIARVVGVRTGSIKPLLLRARRRLASLIGSADGGAK
jgi:RNA polymerase sigma-70 factor (ECF subfamily)